MDTLLTPTLIHAQVQTIVNMVKLYKMETVSEFAIHQLNTKMVFAFSEDAPTATMTTDMEDVS